MTVQKASSGMGGRLMKQPYDLELRRLMTDPRVDHACDITFPVQIS